MKVIVPDTGALIDGRITETIEKESANKNKVKVVVAQSAVAELEYQANVGKETGLAGLQELKKISQAAKQGLISIEFLGERPNSFEIENARFGEIDSKIRGIAKQVGGVLITTDKIQREVAEAEGIEVLYLEPVIEQLHLTIEKFFSHAGTLSVHLKEGCTPKAKIGKPGEFLLTEIGDRELKRKELEMLIREAVEYAKRKPRSYIEMDKQGVTVLQVMDYRITYTKPPLSEAAEMTIVKPIVKLSLEDYSLTDRLKKRLHGEAEGILIAGPPGSGKSTFAAALADYYHRKNAVVKTLEQPRDLQVNKEVTQYGQLEGSFEATTDVLLLVRPDYTIFDEVRRTNDFVTFSDLRLAGIGMVGVVHASRPIDAVQRFIGKIDLGMIPQVIDTIVFIQKGKIAKVFDLVFTVKTPFGMREQDLARPVIQVRDFDSKEVEFELYKWGDETVVFPVKQAKVQQGLREEVNPEPSGGHGRKGAGNWRRRR